jgi:CheY-like chemotaxis protein
VEATGKIRQWEKANHIDKRVPIVAMTANTMMREKELFISAGMDDYLGKPFNSGELVSLIERIYRKIEQKIYN